MSTRTIAKPSRFRTAFLGGPFSYEREVLIQRPHAEVFPYLKLLRNFQNWNPFTKKDSSVRIEYRGADGTPGFVSSWQGDRKVGAGEQEITRVVDDRKIEFQLRFKKPFKATNAGYFSAEPAGEGQTRVRWGMSGDARFPASLINLFIDCDVMIGGEFDSGLKQLKTLLEK
jgi:hypothetical protein